MRKLTDSQTFSETMKSDTVFRKEEDAAMKRDARRFEEYTKNDVARALANIQGGAHVK